MRKEAKWVCVQQVLTHCGFSVEFCLNHPEKGTLNRIPLSLHLQLVESRLRNSPHVGLAHGRAPETITGIRWEAPPVHPQAYQKPERNKQKHRPCTLILLKFCSWSKCFITHGQVTTHKPTKYFLQSAGCTRAKPRNR